MATSANVVEYEIRDKSDSVVGTYRRNFLCKRDTRSLMKYAPASDFTIHPYGYDEEGELWEGSPSKLSDWLEKNPNEVN